MKTIITLTFAIFLCSTAFAQDNWSKCVDENGNSFAVQGPCPQQAQTNTYTVSCCKKTHGNKPGFDYHALINGSCSGQAQQVTEPQCFQLQGNAILHVGH